MLATKETAPLALGCMLLALALTHLVDRWRRERALRGRSAAAVRGRHVLLALLAAVIVSAALFSSFLGHPEGIVDAVRAYGLYLDRARTASWHFHPWPYYLAAADPLPFDAERPSGPRGSSSCSRWPAAQPAGLRRASPGPIRGPCVSSASTRS